MLVVLISLRIAHLRSNVESMQPISSDTINVSLNVPLYWTASLHIERVHSIHCCSKMIWLLCSMAIHSISMNCECYRSSIQCLMFSFYLVSRFSRASIQSNAFLFFIFFILQFDVERCFQCIEPSLLYHKSFRSHSGYITQCVLHTIQIFKD